MKNWWFWTVVLDKTLENPFDWKEIHPVILKEINPEYSLEGLMLKLNLQYFGQLMWRTDSFENILILGKTEGRSRKGRQNKVVGWYHRLDGHESEQAPGVGNGQGSLAGCHPLGRRVGHDWVTELTWTESHVFTGGQRQTMSRWAEQKHFTFQSSRGAGSSRQAPGYDYNN